MLLRMRSMNTEKRCLLLIDRVREAAGDPAAAYLIRSRLRRAILGCARVVAETYGAPKPEIPGLFVAPAGISDTDRGIVLLCNRIYGTARELCQPSESFDVRWAEGWATLERELDQLRLAMARRHKLVTRVHT